MTRIKWRLPRSWADVRMSKFMAALALLGFVAVPILWSQGQTIWAIVAMLTVFTLLVQAACIDLPGTPTYDEIDAPGETPSSPKSGG